MADMNERDAKLVQWLNEAHAKEAELEADLTAHIALTQKDSYKKRLKQHLTETGKHKRLVASRIKKLGGSASAGPNLPGVPDAVGEVAGKTIAAIKGQVGVARALATEQAETHMRNAQEELREEHVEIAIYTRIELLAEAVGDRETTTLAKGIRRDEERMARFLEAELKRLVKEVVKAEIPADQRVRKARPTASRRSTAASRTKKPSASAKSSARTRTSSARASAEPRKTTARKRSG